ncbi:MAG: glycosyl hydrolase family 18 protein [Flavobacteriales bacterium]
MKKRFLLTSLLVFFCFLSIDFFAQLPCNVLVGYWQSSWGTSVRLKDINSNYNVINLSFLEAGGGDGQSDNNVVSALNFSATNNANLLADIPVVQAQGKVVLMSIGGANGSFKLSSSSDVNTFLSKVKTVIQTYGLDGVDIDLERSVYLNQTSGGSISSPESHITYMISALQQLLAWYQTTYSKKMILTMVPEVAYTVGGLSDYMSKTYGVPYLALIEALRDHIDLVMVQLYNASGGSYGLDGKVYYEATADFIVSQTEAMINGFTCVNSKGTYSGLDASKIAVCLPASSAAASSGYVSTTVAKSALDYLLGVGSKPVSYTLKTSGGYPSLKGMATWSINTDLDASYSFANNYATIFSACPTTTSQQELEAQKPIKLFPNPASDFINLDGTNLLGETVKVYDISGQILLQQTITNNTVTMDISSLSSGLYFVQVSSLSQTLAVDK